MVNNFLLSGSVQYLKVTGSISDKLIKRCLDQGASNAKVIETIVREPHRYGHGGQQVSVVLFKKEKRPSFLSIGGERDIAHGFAMIVEIDDYLIISKSHASDFSDLLDKYVSKVESFILNAALMDPKASIEKATAKTIDTRRDSVRQITWEADNLEESMPTYGASSKVLTTIKHSFKGRKYSVKGNTSKVTMLGTRVSIKEFITAGIQAINKFKSPPRKHKFLDNFAIPLKFDDHVNKIVPREILFSIQDIVDFIQSSGNPAPRLLYKMGRSERYINVDIFSIFESLSALMEIEPEGRGKDKHFYIKNDFDDTLELCHTEKKYYLLSSKFKNLFLEFDEDNRLGIQTLINRSLFFNITFDKANIHYADGQLCRDSKLLGNIEGFLQMFKVDAALATIISEKGDIKSTSRNFDADTLFRYVEDNFMGGLDHLVLDDLGYEVADYVGVKKLNKIQLIHCKEGTAKLSASRFQEVVGQAIKNLNFFIPDNAVDAKMNLWNQKYKKSHISRIRKADKAHLMSDLKQSLAATNCDREVHLVVNFLSFQVLKRNLLSLQSGGKSTRATVPVLWLLSSLKTNCAERGVKIYIHCKP